MTMTNNVTTVADVLANFLVTVSAREVNNYLLSLVTSTSPFFESLRAYNNSDNTKAVSLTPNQLSCLFDQLTKQGLDYLELAKEFRTNLLNMRAEAFLLELNEKRQKEQEEKEFVNSNSLEFVGFEENQYRTVRVFNFGGKVAKRESYLQKGKEKFVWSVEGMNADKQAMEALYLKLS